MPDDGDFNVIAPLIGELHDWTLNKGGRSSEDILSEESLTRAQRALFLEHADHLAVCHAAVATARLPVTRSRGRARSSHPLAE